MQTRRDTFNPNLFYLSVHVSAHQDFIFFVCFQVHVAKESSIPDHCRQYALSDPQNAAFKTVCNHTHDDRCDRCEELSMGLREIDRAIAEMANHNVSDEAHRAG